MWFHVSRCAVRKSNSGCPIDSKKLSSGDLFPDNFTSREIKNIKRPCPNAKLGCAELFSSIDIDQHLERTCRYTSRNFSSQHSTIDCPFTKYGCTFRAISNSQLDTHNQENMRQHLNVSSLRVLLIWGVSNELNFSFTIFVSGFSLSPNAFQMLVHAFSQNKTFDFKSIEALKLWDPPRKSATDQVNGSSNARTPDDGDADSASRDSYNDALLRALYERIVTLEQLSREQGLQIERLTAQMNKLTNANSAGEVSARYSGGTLVWKITQFSQKVQEMDANSNNRFYSSDVYTSPFGYRFCARINIGSKTKGYIALHLHLMQSENDYHLDWPFRGCFNIWLLHRDMRRCLHDKIMTNATVQAFERPVLDISPRGFGFTEYANIEEIQNKGYVSKDTLTIKVHIGIV